VFLLVSFPLPSRATLECYDCHGTREPADVRPLDAPYRNVTTGGFPGNHRSHASPATGFGPCIRCHPGSDRFTPAHRDGMVKISANINGSRLTATYNNTTSAFPQTPEPQPGTCTNVNCHFEATTPAWGGPPLSSPLNCNACHGFPPLGGETGAAGSHAVHAYYYSGVPGCGICHPSHPGFGHATSVGRPLVVAPRHPVDSEAGSYSGPVDDYLPSQTNILGTCSGIYCHSDGTGVATGTQAFATPLWGATLGCNGCHGFPPAYASGSPKANSHGRHQYSCNVCHVNTTADGVNITFTAHHVNKSYNVAPAATGAFVYTYAAGGGSCSANYCHTNGTSLATGAPVAASATWGTPLNFACNGCHGFPPAYATGSPKANSHAVPEHAQYRCNKCHNATTSTGGTITSPANHANRDYTVVPNVAGLFSYTFQPTGGVCNNVGCHFDASPRTWGTTLACDACHECPPQTASHLRHYGGSVADAGYGDTRSAKDFGATATAYLFNCGTCHPLDKARHRNGLVDVELYNAQSPAGSLKSRNPATAAYTPGGSVLIDNRGYPYTQGTCSNIYCHSYNEWTTPAGTLVTTRLYQSPTWEGSMPTDCSGCHGNPPRTYGATNNAGQGDSHYYVVPDYYRTNYDIWDQGHSTKTWFPIEPIPCSACHNSTVTQANRWSRQPPVTFTFYSGVPIANKASHVNGTTDVTFDRQRQFAFTFYDFNTYPYELRTVYHNLSGASFTPGSGGSKGTCSNISCHRAQTSVQWGTPYRGYQVFDTGDFTDCNSCHADSPKGW
jgi:predicted CxxxxCH...CXXCH cytochrome family protein